MAGIYLRRLRRRVLVVCEGKPRVERIPRIRNLIGYEKGISGRRLIAKLRRQYKRYGGDTIQSRAEVSKGVRGFEVHCDGQVLKARKIILATGMKDLEPPGGRLQELTDKGLVGYCPICDGFDHTREKIALIISSAEGLAKVPFMLGFSSNLIIVKTAPFAISPSQQKTLLRLNIGLAPGNMKSVRATPAQHLDIQMDDGRKIRVQSAYVLLGARAVLDAVKSLKGLKKSRKGFLTVNCHQETSIAGLYAVGDCVDGLSQISVAAGHAAIAATDVHNKLRPKISGL